MRLNWFLGCTLLAAATAFAGQADAPRNTHRAIGHAGSSQIGAPEAGGNSFAASKISGQLHSSVAMVVDQETGQTLLAKNSDATSPIASITKLMTAMVVLDAQLPLDEKVTITKDDIDVLRGTHSRLKVGTVLTRELALQLALMSSENRAAAALGRVYPGGRDAFIAAMNRKAESLGMKNTRFVDSTGLSNQNTSTAQDLVKMVEAAYQYPVIRDMTTTGSYNVAMRKSRQQFQFRNTNMLVRNKKWEIGLSKTGFINEAGHCLVMQARIANKPVIIVLLDSWGKLSRIGDAQRIKKWVETSLFGRQRFS